MDDVTNSGTVPDTEQEQAQAQGEQDAAIALAEEDRWQIAGGDAHSDAGRGVGSRADRRAYLDGAASVLGYKPLVSG